MIKDISGLAGFLPSYVDRMLRVLRPVGMAPMGVPGRGKTEGIFEPFHYACLILGFAGKDPSDAAEAAEALRHLVYRRFRTGPEVTRTPALPSDSLTPRAPGTLGEVLEAIIRGGWGSEQQAADQVYYAPDLRLFLSPPAAQIRWPATNVLPGLREDYGPAPGTEYSFRSSGIEKPCYVTSAMLRLAASLWQGVTFEPDRTSGLIIVRSEKLVPSGKGKPRGRTT